MRNSWPSFSSALFLLLLWQTCAHSHIIPGRHDHHHHHFHGDGEHRSIARTLKQAPAPGPGPGGELLAVPVTLPLPTENLTRPSLGNGFSKASADDGECGAPGLLPGLSLATDIFFEFLYNTLPSNNSLKYLNATNLAAWRTVLKSNRALPTLWLETISLAKEYFNLTLPTDPSKLKAPSLPTSGSSRRLLQTSDVLYRVPVWFIAVKPDNQPFGYTTKNFELQVDKLNSGFAGTGFEFYLAGHKGFSSTAWFDTDYSSDLDRRYTRQYREGGAETLNIFVRKPLLDGEGVNGVAYLPQVLCSYGVHNVSRLEQDAVAILYETLPGVDPTGRRFGATTVHEVGHWLGLSHTFNDNNCDEDQGDGVSDTPLEKMAYHRNPNYVPGTCDATFDSCPDSPGTDPTSNFMNYAPDKCRVEFTQNQIFKMKWHYYTFRLQKECSISGSVTSHFETNGGGRNETSGTSLQMKMSAAQSALLLVLSMLWAFSCL